MPSTVPAGAAPALARRVVPWLIIVAILVAGLALCFAFGPQIIPIFLQGRA